MLFLMVVAPLLAQTFVELRFVQRLTWVSDEYAMRYEVIIEKEERGRFSRVLQRFAETNFVEVSLAAGKYRFQVVPHDFFNRPINVADWVSFEVLAGDDKLSKGQHEAIMVNPDNKESRTGIMITAQEQEPTDKQQNQYDIYLGLSYVPLLPIYGENQFFGENLSLLGASLRLGVVSAKPKFICYGMELAASWRIYDSNEQDVKALTFDINGLAQTRFSGGRTALNFRFGAGTSLHPNLNFMSSNSQYVIHANMGISFLCLITSNLYFELGINYSHFLTKDPFGSFQPWLGLGCRF